MKKISLNGKWRLIGRPEGNENAEKIEINAIVPGNVQLDLSRAGYLPNDLYMGENILETEKFEGYEWWYETEFEAPTERHRVYLVFRAVDTLAEYFLNGKKIGESDNMFIPHEFEVSSYLKDGKNTLTVHLSSVAERENGADIDIKSVLSSWFSPSEVPVRNAAHLYGWDILPRALTAGIWREVYLEVRKSIRFSQTFFEYDGAALRFAFVLDCPREDIKSLEVEVSLECGDSVGYMRRPVYRKTGAECINIENPKLWWPYGYGEPNMYGAVLRIYKNGVCVHEENASLGLRTVELERTDVTDGKSGCFRFLVNGTEIMCKGSNWVPLDAFHSRDAERYESALALVKEVGCNILRCWGGGVYEDHEFYDYCDRNGIMVWQDFMMACNCYPQNDGFLRQIEREATAIVREYRLHPSIILWSGDNEVDYMAFSNHQDPKMNRITREILPRVVYANDSLRPYLPSSPYVSDEVLKRGATSVPEDHLWGPRTYYKGEYYKKSNAHFVSETGYHGCPHLESIKKFITPERVWPYHNNPEWILHSSDQKNRDDRVMLMERQVKTMFAEVPNDPDRYILASQISQAEAKKYFIERIRVGRPYKSGIIWWNLLDGWPQMSDAVVDYYFNKKLAFEYIKRSQAPFILAFGELEGTSRVLYACNDTLKSVCGTYRVTDAETDELVCEGSFTAAENTSSAILTLRAEQEEKRIFIIEWQCEGFSGRSHYLCGEAPYDFDKYVRLMKKHNLNGEIFN